MHKFRVETVCYEKWLKSYEVEANSLKDAKQKVLDGEGELVSELGGDSSEHFHHAEKTGQLDS